jgi:serine/threonine-protein kinase HipA
MLNNAFVNIWGYRVGAVAWNPNAGIGSFQYAPEFLESGLDLSPIQLPMRQGSRIFSFPELRDSDTFKGLPGLLADVLPDAYGHALINTWLTRHGRPSNSLNPVETLSFIGQRGMGALEFEPVDSLASNESSSLEISSLVKTAEQILSGRKDFHANLNRDEDSALHDILKIGTSAGGARAKAIIAYNPATRDVRSGQTTAPSGYSYWIIKFDGVHDSQFGASTGYGRVEMAYYLMALDAGIEMMECSLLEENGRAHFMTKRFDRDDDNNKLHVQTFCAIRHYDFNLVGLFSYEQLFETMRILRLTYPQAEQMFIRMCFNVLARNCDDHTQNFAFVMNEHGNWSLSPAYDICHAYRPGSQWVSQHALSINSKRDDIERQDLMSVGWEMNIKYADSIIDKVYEVVGNWSTYAQKAEVREDLAQRIQDTFVKW